MLGQHESRADGSGARSSETLRIPPFRCELTTFDVTGRLPLYGAATRCRESIALLRIRLKGAFCLQAATSTRCSAEPTYPESGCMTFATPAATLLLSQVIHTKVV